MIIGGGRGDDGQGNLGVVGKVVGDAAQVEVGEATGTAGANDQKVGAFGGGVQQGIRVPLDQQGIDRSPAGAGGAPVGESPLRFGAKDLGVIARQFGGGGVEA